MEQVSAVTRPTASRFGAAWMLSAAVLAVAVGFAALWGGIVAHFLGYLLASLLAFTLVALFRRAAMDRQTSSGVVVPHWMNLVAAGVLLVGFVVAVGQAWFIASHFS
jgi:hypothetical protein